MAVDHIRPDIALEDIVVTAAGPGDGDIDAELVNGGVVQRAFRGQHGGMAQQGRRDVDMRQGQRIDIDPGRWAFTGFGRQRTAQQFHFRSGDPHHFIMIAEDRERRPFHLRVRDAQPGSACIPQFDFAGRGAGRQAAIQPFDDHFAIGGFVRNPFDQAMAGRRP